MKTTITKFLRFVAGFCLGWGWSDFYTGKYQEACVPLFIGIVALMINDMISLISNNLDNV